MKRFKSRAGDYTPRDATASAASADVGARENNVDRGVKQQ